MNHLCLFCDKHSLGKCSVFKAFSCPTGYRVFTCSSFVLCSTLSCDIIYKDVSSAKFVGLVCSTSFKKSRKKNQLNYVKDLS